MSVPQWRIRFSVVSSVWCMAEHTDFAGTAEFGIGSASRTQVVFAISDAGHGKSAHQHENPPRQYGTELALRTSE